MPKTISHKPLWKLFSDREMNKAQLQAAAGISGATVSKLRHGKNATTDVLLKICNALNCSIEDIHETEELNEQIQIEQ